MKHIEGLTLSDGSRITPLAAWVQRDVVLPWATATEKGGTRLTTAADEEFIFTGLHVQPHPEFPVELNAGLALWQGVLHRPPPQDCLVACRAAPWIASSLTAAPHRLQPPIRLPGGQTLYIDAPYRASVVLYGHYKKLVVG